MSIPRLRRRTGRLAIAFLAMASLVLATSVAQAANESASDPVHADFHTGNVVSCSQIGLPGSTTSFANGSASISGAVTGSVQAHPGGGQEANITGVAAGVVIDAVVIKAGAAYNVYEPLPPQSGTEAASHVFPDYPGPYIAPLNGGGNIPNISHWFVCYHGGDVPPPPPPPGPGSLLVSKIVNNAGGAVLPTSYVVHITCDDGTEADRTLPSLGGDAIEGPVTDILANSLCNVTETSALPEGTGVVYTPAEAGPGGDGVMIVSGQEITVTVTNTFIGVLPEVVVRPPEVQVAQAAQAVAVPAAFTG